ncbi:MAG: hypothetical protein K1W30_01930 [Lachnospiraceae bacterium]
MEKETFITNEEREKCGKVKEAYAEFYEQEDIFVIDAGRYGFVKLLYYTEYNDFENMNTYIDSKSLFDALWSDWLDYKLYDIASNTRMMELSYDEIFDNLPENIQEELIAKRSYFAEKAEMEIC